LRSSYLKDARQRAREGSIAPAELRDVEDRAVREAIPLQESAGVDTITYGKLRRSSRVVKLTAPMLLWDSI